jgi:hypothetical protein
LLQNQTLNIPKKESPPRNIVKDILTDYSVINIEDDTTKEAHTVIETPEKA